MILISCWKFTPLTLNRHCNATHVSCWMKSVIETGTFLVSLPSPRSLFLLFCSPAHPSSESCLIHCPMYHLHTDLTGKWKQIPHFSAGHLRWRESRERERERENSQTCPRLLKMKKPVTVTRITLFDRGVFFKSLCMTVSSLSLFTPHCDSDTMNWIDKLQSEGSSGETSARKTALQKRNNWETRRNVAWKRRKLQDGTWSYEGKKWIWKFFSIEILRSRGFKTDKNQKEKEECNKNGHYLKAYWFVA